MALITIASAGDVRLRDYTNLTDVSLRRVREPAEGLFVAEGETVVRRALAAGFRPRSILASARWADGLHDVAAEFPDVPFYVADEEVLRGVTGYLVHRGALSSMHRKPLPDARDLLRTAIRVALLEDLVDHTNVGAVFRSAAALGIDAVLVTPRCADPLYRRSVKVSMGSVFAVPWGRAEPWPGLLDDARDLGFTSWALTPGEGSVPLPSARIPARVLLMLGTEGAGLSPQALDRCDARVRIPMAAGVDSLNVAAASAVAFYALGPGAPPG